MLLCRIPWRFLSTVLDDGDVRRPFVCRVSTYDPADCDDHEYRTGTEDTAGDHGRIEVTSLHAVRRWPRRPASTTSPSASRRSRLLPISALRVLWTASGPTGPFPAVLPVSTTGQRRV